MSFHIEELYLQKLIEMSIRGENPARGKLYKIFAPKMFCVCLRYSRNRQEAEEILQEGFLKAFLLISQFKNKGAFEGWIRKIMVNCALQKLRKKTNLKIVSLEEAPFSASLFNVNEFHKLEVKELIKLVQELSPRYRAVFNLYVFEGLKHREIAKALNISVGTSKSNLNSARFILQEKIINSFIVNDERITADNKLKLHK